MAAFPLPLPFFDRAEDGAGGASSASTSTLARFARLPRVDGAGAVSMASSGVASRAGAFRFRDVVGGGAAGGGGGAGGLALLGSVAPAERLAAERVILDDMSLWFSKLNSSGRC